MIRNQEIRVTFRSDDADADAIKDAMEKAVLAMCEPTEENTSALFHLAAERILVSSRKERER